MQELYELYELAEALKPFRLTPADVAAVGAGRGLNTIQVMKLVKLVCGGDVVQAKSVATEARHGVTLSEHQEQLFQDVLDSTEDELDEPASLPGEEPREAVQGCHEGDDGRAEDRHADDEAP